MSDIYSIRVSSRGKPLLVVPGTFHKEDAAHIIRQAQLTTAHCNAGAERDAVWGKA